MNTEKIREEKMFEPEIDHVQDPVPSSIPTEERIRIFANIIIDRILELQKSGVVPIGMKRI